MKPVQVDNENLVTNEDLRYQGELDEGLIRTISFGNTSSPKIENQYDDQ